MGRKLYPWQEECLQRWFANNGRGMVQAVTGSGKTLLALAAIDRLEQTLQRELRVKIVVPTSALMRQWERALCGRESAPAKKEPPSRKEIGLRGAGYNAPANRKYMIYVINSARYELARQILADLREGAAVLLIADECHHYESRQNRLIFEFLPQAKPYESQYFSLGLSATLPSGSAGAYLASVLGRKIYTYGMKQAASMHTICRYDVFHIALSFQQKEREEYDELSEQMNYLFTYLLRRHPFLRNLTTKELFEALRALTEDQNRKTAEAAGSYLTLTYRRKSLVCLASARIRCACSLIELLPAQEKIIVFGERIAQADALFRLLQKRYPGRTGRFHSQMGDVANRNTLNRFRDGDIRILIACKSMDEGIDIPDASIGVILSGTSMQRQRTQRLGRVIRNAAGKDRASLYYLHLEDTMEDRCFLPDQSETHLFELEYCTDTYEFTNPSYDLACEQMMEELEDSGADDRILAEADRCLRLGRVRSDWLMPADEIAKRLREQNCTEGRNYWLCMKRLGASPRA